MVSCSPGICAHMLATALGRCSLQQPWQLHACILLQPPRLLAAACAQTLPFNPPGPQVKAAMKRAPKAAKVLLRCLNARQFGLKLIANVTYGYTAAGFSGGWALARRNCPPRLHAAPRRSLRWGLEPRACATAAPHAPSVSRPTACLHSWLACSVGAPARRAHAHGGAGRRHCAVGARDAGERHPHGERAPGLEGAGGVRRYGCAARRAGHTPRQAACVGQAPEALVMVNGEWCACDRPSTAMACRPLLTRLHPF